MTHEECVKHHREIHAPMVARSALGRSIKKYVGHYPEQAQGWTMSPDGTPKGIAVESPYDVIAELWFDEDTYKNLGEFRKSPEGRAINQDEGNWMDRKKMVTIVFEDNVII